MTKKCGRCSESYSQISNIYGTLLTKYLLASIETKNKKRDTHTHTNKKYTGTKLMAYRALYLFAPFLCCPSPAPRLLALLLFASHSRFNK